jgi:medium-chain acyl-[acyl-carrier-protein] hydrolase
MAAEQDQLTLYCFPYAGGSARVLLQCQRWLGSRITMVPMEMPEPSLGSADAGADTFDVAVRMLCTEIRRLREARYAFWGHSMGSLLAYEVARRLARDERRGPAHLFLSGMRPPHRKDRDVRLTQQLSDDELLDTIRSNQTIPEHVLERPDFRSQVLQMLRRDLATFRSYRPRQPTQPELDMPMSVLIGRADDVNVHGIDEWARYTSGDCSIHYFEGGHFFIFERMQRVAEIICEAARNEAIAHVENAETRGSDPRAQAVSEREL